MPQIFDVMANEDARYKCTELESLFRGATIWLWGGGGWHFWSGQSIYFHHVLGRKIYFRVNRGQNIYFQPQHIFEKTKKKRGGGG